MITHYHTRTLYFFFLFYRIPYAAGLTLVAPDDGCICPKHVEPSLFYNKLSYVVASSWFFYSYSLAYFLWESEIS
jgi:hypothetical protein